MLEEQKERIRYESRFGRIRSKTEGKDRLSEQKERVEYENRIK